MGLFGSVQVKWTVDPSDEIDLRPASGLLTFNSDQDTAFISLESVPDEVCTLLFEVFVQALIYYNMLVKKLL